MMALLAQMPDAVLNGLVQAVLLGPIVLWFMWRDGKERDRLTVSEARRDLQMDSMIETINHLVRMTAIEVLTRTHIVERTRQETNEILTATENRGKR